jgi:hypothetical protein
MTGLEPQRESNRLLLAFIETDAWTKAIQPMLAARQSELLDQIASLTTPADRTHHLKHALQEFRLLEEKLSRDYLEKQRFSLTRDDTFA